jgi:hypothetical protein
VTDPLAEAVALLLRARDDNEHRAAQTTRLDETSPVRAEIRAERYRIAVALLAAAAIGAGFPPAYPAARPEPGQETP